MTNPWLVMGLMALSEIIFIALAVLTTHRPQQVPLRASQA